MTIDEAISRVTDLHAFYKDFERNKTAVADCDALGVVLSELSRLRSALPRTADGVTIVPGMEIWSYRSVTRHVVEDVRRETFHAICDCHGQKHFCVGEGVDGTPDEMRSFSTAEAAIASRKETVK